MTSTLTRRSLVAAAPAAIVAASMPAFAAGAHPDASLLALRGPWRDSIAAFEAAIDAKGEIEEQIFARSRPYLDFKEWTGSINEYIATNTSITAERAGIHEELGGVEADQLECDMAAASGAVVEQIEATPARTLAGILFKVEVSEGESHNRPELIDSIMADIKAMAGGGFDA